MVTSFPAYLEGSLDTVKMEPPKNRLDAKVDFCDLPLSSSLLQQALLSSKACAAGAVFVGVGRGSFEGSLWLGGRLEGKGKARALSWGGGEGLQGTDTEPLSTVSSARKDSSLLRNISGGPPGGGVPSAGSPALLLTPRSDLPLNNTPSPALLFIRRTDPNNYSFLEHSSVSHFSATRPCPFQMTPSSVLLVCGFFPREQDLPSSYCISWLRWWRPTTGTWQTSTE